MIGNSNYVRKHYSDTIAAAIAHFDELRQLWPRTNYGQKQIDYVNLALEVHTSRNTSAWHGIRLHRDGTWHPMSFYGRGSLTPSEYRSILAGKEV